jgi:chromosome segregation protein
MRLTKIKLAGFKSFVDPTTIYIPSKLVGVVGPNGCGKSNIIDAVRWVMGESSAKHLRGDSMADVIFNGSTARKPVGHASIELAFDNSEGKVTGQYAGYNEIAIRRQVSRDGTSTYFLNGTKCRRRDITDIFLGTGLGPRSYSIIEQGMISRLIEAKPEELRVFLEEAAGISKYKERRRETENRIKHTRENLDRLNDLLEEIDKQLDKLKRQSRAAERYKELKEEERQVKAELLALRYSSLHGDCSERDKQIRELETSMEAELAAQRAVEAELEKLREALTGANESFNEVQGDYYRLGADVARIEQAIQHSWCRRSAPSSRSCRPRPSGPSRPAPCCRPPSRPCTSGARRGRSSTGVRQSAPSRCRSSAPGWITWNATCSSSTSGYSAWGRNS